MQLFAPLNKRCFDLFAGALLMAAALPAMLAIALALSLRYRCNPIFTQVRMGRGGKCFVIYKFRTMFSPPSHDHTGHTLPCEPTLTPLGRFLRNTSLDELPQFFNVLKGDMSLVGPRPVADYHHARYAAQIENFETRLAMRPGITGLVQVTSLRYDTHDLQRIRERLRCDLYYIRHWSMWLDIKIMWKTMLIIVHPRSVFLQRAYYDIV